MGEYGLIHPIRLDEALAGLNGMGDDNGPDDMSCVDRRQTGVSSSHFVF
jgi:hypothetical protein